jgi:hypothetical protein
LVNNLPSLPRRGLRGGYDIPFLTFGIYNLKLPHPALPLERGGIFNDAHYISVSDQQSSKDSA